MQASLPPSEISTADQPVLKNGRKTARRLLIGLDIGGTKIQGIAVDTGWSLNGQARLEMDAANAERAVESILTAVRRVLAEAETRPGELAAIGLGIPGQVQDGIVRHAVNLKLDAYPLAETLEQSFGAPVEIENDVRTAAVGVYHHLRQERQLGSLAYLSIGTGISAGMILNGSLYRGRNGMAGEVGHVVVDPGGRRCNCGLRGCLETVAAGPALAHEALRAVRAGVKTSLRGQSPLTAETVYKAAQQGDRVAQDILRRASRYLARAVYALLMNYDVDLLAIGGGVSHAGPAFLDPLLEELDLLGKRSSLARSMLAEDRISLISPEFEAGAWGAVTLAKHALREGIS
jgi:glucokinase